MFIGNKQRYRHSTLLLVQKFALVSDSGYGDWTYHDSCKPRRGDTDQDSRAVHLLLEQPGRHSQLVRQSRMVQNRYVLVITCYTFASCFCTHCFTSVYLFCISSASLLHVASWATVKQAVREVGTICPAQACKSTISSYLFARWDLFLHVGYLRHQQQHIYWKWCPSHVTCDVGYLCAYFSLPRPLCSRRRPDVRDRRQTSVSITG